MVSSLASWTRAVPLPAIVAHGLDSASCARSTACANANLRSSFEDSKALIWFSATKIRASLRPRFINSAKIAKNASHCDRNSEGNFFAWICNHSMKRFMREFVTRVPS